MSSGKYSLLFEQYLKAMLGLRLYQLVSRMGMLIKLGMACWLGMRDLQAFLLVCSLPVEDLEQFELAMLLAYS